MDKNWKSLPSRGAWIEISIFMFPLWLMSRRSPHGERGLKFRVGQGVEAVRVAPLTGSVD